MTDTATAPDADTLLTTLLARLGRAKAAAGDDDEPDELSSGKVPVDRLRREIAKRRALEEQITAIGAEVAGLRKAHADALTAIRADAATQVTAIGARHLEDLQLVDAGLTDPLGREALRTAWGALPESSRGKSPADWWRATNEARAAHAADPTKPPPPDLPRTLAGYLPAPAAGATGSAASGQVDRAAGALPAGPAKARGPADVAAVPADAGMAGLLAALRPKA